jgi:TusA-related sulfurtransferase
MPPVPRASISMSGDIMEVLSADEGTKRDIPKWANKKGHEYLGTVEESGFFKIYLKKG